MHRPLTKPLWLLVPIIAIPLLSAKEEPASRPVTIVEERISLPKALAKLTEQSRIPVVNSLGKEDDSIQSLDLKGVPFWQALDRIAKGARAEVNLYRHDGQIELIRRGPPPQLPVSYSGLFRVAVRKLTAVNDFAAQSRSYTFSFEVAWEPSFEPFYLETRPHKVQMQDDAGKAVDVPSLGTLWSAVDERRAVLFDVDLPALPRASARIGLLKGTLSSRGPVRMHEFRWLDKEKRDRSLQDLALDKKSFPLQVSAGENLTTCSLNSVNANPNSRRWTVQITTQLPAEGPIFESNQTWYVHNELYLVSRDGKQKVRSTSYDQENAGERRAVLNYHFDIPRDKRGQAKDWVLLYRAPAAMIELSIPFEFKDLPLP